MKRWQVIGIAALALVVAMVLFATVGLQEATNLTIGSVNLSAVSDGRYIGQYSNGRFSNTVAVTVANHKITGVEALKAPDGRGALVAELAGRILTSQQTDVDVIAGGTASSNGFLKAVENALTGAVNP